MAQAVKRATKAAAEAVAEIDAEIDAVMREIEERSLRVKELRHERQRWAALANSRPEAPAEAAAMASAGPSAVAAVANYLRKHGTAYQYQITKDTKLNSGTVTHALRVLAHDHTIAATGRKRRNSAEFEWTGENNVKLVKGRKAGEFVIKDHLRTTHVG